jgi:hypothetical protein
MIQYGHHSQIRVFHRSCLDNIFFAIERKKIIQEQEHADGTPVKVEFANMANIVSERWKNIDPEYKEELERGWPLLVTKSTTRTPWCGSSSA